MFERHIVFNELLAQGFVPVDVSKRQARSLCGELLSSAHKAEWLLPEWIHYRVWSRVHLFRLPLLLRLIPAPVTLAFRVGFALCRFFRRCVRRFQDRGASQPGFYRIDCSALSTSQPGFYRIDCSALSTSQPGFYRLQN